MKVLELFSGIGGMRCGLTEALPNEELEFISVDVNEFCNKVYEESFGNGPLSLDICGISLDWFTNLGADVWTMSPPCQPYSRQGKGLGSKDERAAPLHHLIGILGQLENLPKLIIVENVKNFEESDSFQELKKVLETLNYDLFGYLLNPLYMGFPNSRLRFFLVAKLGSDSSIPVPFKILCNDPVYAEFDRIDTNRLRNPISDFLCQGHDDVTLRVPDSVLDKPAAFALDVVTRESLQCLCFTRSYRKYINGTGSVLLESKSNLVECLDEKFRPKFVHLKSMNELRGCLRYFCPLEAARLNGFHVNASDARWTLKFKDSCKGGIQYYRAVGNSLNPHVVAFLVKRHWSRPS